MADSCPLCSKNSKKWLWLALAVVAVIIFVNLGKDEANISSGDGIVWENDYQAGMARAKAQDKPVLLAFSATWCPPCKDMKKNAYRDARVVAIAESFVTIIVDVDSQAELASQYNAEYLPTYLVLNSQGKQVLKMVGGHSAADFAAELTKALEKIKAGT